MKIQTKVTLLFIALTSSVIALLSGFIFGFAYYYAFEDFYKRLETRVRIAHAIHVDQNNENSELAQTLRRQYLEKLPSEREYIISLSPDHQGKVLHQENLPGELLENILSKEESRYKDGNKFFAGRLYKTSSGNVIVIVSATDPAGLAELSHLSKILVIGFVISVIVVYIIGRVFSYQTFKPVRELASKVQNITAENLHQRLDTGTGKDEIHMLGQTFNDMLIRLETAFETQNNFISNASHELRTPLTIIKGEAELALRLPGLVQPHHQSVQIILQEAEKLNQILTGLLSLAQSGFDGKKQQWEVVRTDELVWMVKDTVDQLYPGNNIRVNFDGLPEDENQLKVLGNINLLKLALGNIVANACKYSYNKLVLIQLLTGNDHLVIRIKDEGIGIPEQELQYVFEPFFRASNTSDFEGYGVGLPLSLNIIQLHKGSISIQTQEGIGTEILVRLPIAPPQEADLPEPQPTTSQKQQR
jgi:signal transduction histidine kinase